MDHLEEGETLLLIEYDVADDGLIELIALINAFDEEGHDPGGWEWLAWWRTHEDEGMGCAPVPPADLKAMESTEDPAELRKIVERIILADRVGIVGDGEMSTTRSQLYRFARDLGNIEAVEHGYKRGGLSGAAGGVVERQVRRTIYRQGNRQINKFVRAIGITGRR